MDALQAMFAMQDAAGVAAKYRAFAALDPASERARMFVAHGGLAVRRRAARRPGGGGVPGRLVWREHARRGAWRVGGQAVDPAALRLPTLVALPAQDRIVPPESAARAGR